MQYRECNRCGQVFYADVCDNVCPVCGAAHEPDVDAPEKYSGCLVWLLWLLAMVTLFLVMLEVL